MEARKTREGGEEMEVEVEDRPTAPLSFYCRQWCERHSSLWTRCVDRPRPGI